MANARLHSARISKANVDENQSDTMISTTPVRMVPNLETFACFWLDRSISKIRNYKEIQEELLKIVKHLQLFDAIDECDEAIRKLPQEKVILITSDSFGCQIIPRLHDLPQLLSCYIFPCDSKVDRNWTKKYSKIKGVFSQHSDLLNQFAHDQTNRIRVEDASTISIVSNNTQSLESRNALFMWFQLFIEVLLRMHHKSSSKQELIDICKQYYRTNAAELSVINEFERTYKADKAIWWYTRECYLYRILNKALRTQNFDLLFALRFFITDLSKQLTQEHERHMRELPSRDIIRVYRGQGIGCDELKLMQSNIGEFISMNSFLSTSVRRQTAISFLYTIETTSDVVRTLFEIDIDPRQRTKAFSNIDHLSYFKSEGEVLIMLGALFRIESIEEDAKKNIWIVHITLANEDDFQLKETFAHMKERIGDETNLHSMGKILIEMGEYKQAQKCYQRMIYESELDQSIGYSGLGWADHWLNDYDTSLANLKKSLAIIDEHLPDVSEEKGRICSCIGLVYWRKKEYHEALKYLQKALDIQETILSPEHIDISATYNRCALVYTGLNEIDMALKYHKKCLHIRLKILPPDHPDIATSYNNIGWLYNERIGDYEKALDYFQKALAICRKTLPPTHRDIVRTTQNIRKVNEKLKDK